MITNADYAKVRKAFRSVSKDRLDEAMQTACLQLLEALADGYFCDDTAAVLFRMVKHALGKEYASIQFQRTHFEELTDTHSTIQNQERGLVRADLDKDLLKLDELQARCPPEVAEVLAMLRVCPSKTEAAKRLGISRRTLYQRLAKAKALAAEETE